MNKLDSLPRGFGAFPSLEILDLTYNNLKESTLPENFFNLITLRALYLSDNDFEHLPAGIGKLVNLEIVHWICVVPNRWPSCTGTRGSRRSKTNYK
ncbi:Ras suppressor protein 1 [Clonorchis sinensis]|uniref:Ras suppressor protein 1 n=1 Tax=Clonorchis sinensis TaxID=79923 RepID=G7Y5V7_CLOSI|nr:Ras suppressor protein 1 [Clonorchis sinensis]